MRRRGPDVPEHELDAPRRSEMKFDALSVSRRTPPAGATRPAALACRPRQRLARGRASRPQAARPSNRDFAATQGRRPGSPAGSAPDPRWACRRAITGPSNWPRAHSRKRECLACFGELPGRTDCRNANRRPPFGAPHHGRHARPDSLETPAMGAQSIFSVSAKHVYWTVRQLGPPAAGYLQASVRFRTIQTTFSLVQVSLWT